MRLFKHSHGFVFAFGFDMTERKPDERMICWCDPTDDVWKQSPANQAGWLKLPFAVNPEFIIEVGGKVVAYQPGKCIELTFWGPPFIWSVRTLTPDQSDIAAAA